MRPKQFMCFNIKANTTQSLVSKLYTTSLPTVLCTGRLLFRAFRLTSFVH